MLHWLGLSEAEGMAILAVGFGVVVCERLNRIAALLEGIHTIMWKQMGGGGN